MSHPPDRPREAPVAVSAVLDTLRSWSDAAHSAYAPNTLRAWRADWAEFQNICSNGGLAVLPAAPTTVSQFIRVCVGKGKRPATIRRYCATIARVHLAARQPNPCADEEVKLALKSMSRAQPARQRQARALSWSDIEKFLRGAGEGLQARREKAMLCVAYDTMARRRELVALNVEDLHFEGGSGTALIRRSKTDQAGEGALAYLSYETVREVRDWLQAAEIKDGALFRGFVGRRRLGERLHADQVADIFKRVARWLGLPASEVAQVSGHSIRVGAAQDLLALNIDLASIMQAGRWKDTRMPMRYAERVVAARGGMARAARAQGRDGLS